MKEPSSIIRTSEARVGHASTSRGAEIIPHPMLKVCIARERLRHVADIQSKFGRERLLRDAVKNYRRRLEQLGVAQHIIDAEVAALDAMVLPQTMRRRA
jgi:hypothetical protein